MGYPSTAPPPNRGEQENLSRSSLSSATNTQSPSSPHLIKKLPEVRPVLTACVLYLCVSAPTECVLWLCVACVLSVYILQLSSCSGSLIAYVCFKVCFFCVSAVAAYSISSLTANVFWPLKLHNIWSVYFFQGKVVYNPNAYCTICWPNAYPFGLAVLEFWVPTLPGHHLHAWELTQCIAAMCATTVHGNAH